MPHIIALLDLSFFLIFGGFAAVVIALLALSHLKQKRRCAALLQIANNLGMQFTAEKSDPDAFGFSTMKLFSRGRSRQIRNRISGPMADATGMLFDYRFTVGSGKHSSTHRQTVAAFQIPTAHLPEFSCKPEHFFHKVADLFGFDDIDFESEPAFSKAYHLSGPDEAAVRTLFNADTIRRLEAQVDKHWSIDGQQHWLIVYRANKTIKPEARPEFLLEATEIMNDMTL